jgi:hypothetical protein
MAWFGNEGPPAIAEYRVEDGREYSVKVSSEPDRDEPWAGTIREVGIATAGGASGAFWVEFETAERNPRFYSVWRVDSSGIASLSEILLATGVYAAR